MQNTSILLEAFNLYYQNGMRAFDKKDYQTAKRNILMASEMLYKLAKNTDGDLKRNRINRASELMNLAEEIEKNIEKTTITRSNSASDDLKNVSNNGSKNNQDSENNEESNFETSSRPNVRLDDVAGMENVKDEIRRKIIEPMKHPEIFKKFKKKQGGGILLYGVPGTGKTMVAQAIATEINAAFFSVKSSDIVSKWFGEAEQNVKALFKEARKHKVSIIFFDEFEALGAKRDSYSTVMKRLVPELLAQMQGFEQSDNTLLLIAATNRPWDIDSAFLRPGRFDTPIYVPLPDDAARNAIISKKMNGLKRVDELTIEMMVEATKGFNGADIADNFCEKIKDFAIDRTIKSGVESPITIDDFNETKSVVKSSVKTEDIERIAKYEKQSN